METDAGDGGKGDLMCLRDLDSCSVGIGRVMRPPSEEGSAF
jgi:hypothetical protein